jgi:hypothetical protein
MCRSGEDPLSKEELKEFLQGVTDPTRKIIELQIELEETKRALANQMKVADEGSDDSSSTHLN